MLCGWKLTWFRTSSTLLLECTPDDDDEDDRNGFIIDQQLQEYDGNGGENIGNFKNSFISLRTIS